MTDVIRRAEGDEHQCFHLRGIPLHWTVSDLRTALIAARVSRIGMVQIMTKQVVMKSGKQLMIPNGDALIFFNGTDGRTFTNDIVASRGSAKESKGVFIHIRKMDIPMETRDLQTALLQGLGEGDIASANIPMSVFFEWHSRALRVREQILTMNLQRFSAENPGREYGDAVEAGTETKPQQPTITLEFKNIKEGIKQGLRMRRSRVKEFKLVRFDGNVPCFRFPYAGVANEKTSIYEMAIGASCNTTPPIDAECHHEPPDLITFDPSITSSREYSPAHEALQSSEPPKNDPYRLEATRVAYREPEQTTSGSATETSVLHIKNLPHSLNAVAVTSHVESQLGGAVAFCARFQTKVRVKMEGQRAASEFDVPQRDCAIIFRDIATEKLCLEKGSFEVKRSRPRTVTVTKMESEAKAAEVMEAFKSVTSLRQQMHPSEVSTFDIAYRNILKKSQKDMEFQRVKVQELQNQGHRVFAIGRNILNVQSEWLANWKDSLVHGFRIIPQARIVEPSRNEESPQRNDVNLFPSSEDVSAHPNSKVTTSGENDAAHQTASSSSQQSTVKAPVLDIPNMQLPIALVPNHELPVVPVPAVPDPALLSVINPVGLPAKIQDNTVPLFVKGVYYHWDSCTLSDYFEVELNTRVKFCAISTKTVQGEGNYSNTKLKIPEGHAIIVFADAAGQAACLEQSRFYPARIPPLSNGQRRYLKVDFAGGATKIELAMAAAELQESILFSMPNRDAWDLYTRYEEMVTNHHEILLDNQWLFNKLRVEEGAVFNDVSKSNMELYNDWWQQHQHAEKN